MIERLKQTSGIAFGFKVIGKLSEQELKAFEPQLEFFIAENKKHAIGILADLTEMHGAEWMARWEDLRFLQKHSDHIARMAVVGWNFLHHAAHGISVGRRHARRRGGPGFASGGGHNQKRKKSGRGKNIF